MGHFKSAIIAVFIIAPSGVFADQLDDAEAICAKHFINQPPSITIPSGVFPNLASPYPTEWVHCVGIDKAYKDRIKAKNDADEAADPELKMTRDIAKGLLK